MLKELRTFVICPCKQHKISNKWRKKLSVIYCLNFISIRGNWNCCYLSAKSVFWWDLIPELCDVYKSSEIIKNVYITGPVTSLHIFSVASAGTSKASIIMQHFAFLRHKVIDILAEPDAWKLFQRNPWALGMSPLRRVYENVVWPQ